jgi:hypothetical protein
MSNGSITTAAENMVLQNIRLSYFNGHGKVTAGLNLLSTESMLDKTTVTNNYCFELSINQPMK